MTTTTIEIDGKELPYQDDGWSHCDVCDNNHWDENIEWAECGHEDDSRDWWMICKPCFTKHEVKKNDNTYDDLINWLFENHNEVFNQWGQIVGENNEHE